MKHIPILFLLIVLQYSLSAQEVDSLPPTIENFINNEIELAGLTTTCPKLQRMLLRKNNKIVVLDARGVEAFRKKRIRGAKRVGYDKSTFTLTNIWYLNKNKTVIIYCQNGINSKEAARIMRGMGFENTYTLLGGFDEWTRRLLPTVGNKRKKR